ncbi:hypothetical protein QNH32_05290 [Priestia flexa]|uniref:hypothetical protein n=1 Tax=Priestia flexa TaxID=86664 RepID=UPI0024C072E0|nr:hypothetical protein [Priestia flexa]WHX80023.1 hypothetical protein QNH32_05290 [Priestia flexa]
MKILINYSDNNFRKQQIKNTKSGFRHGGFDRVIEYGPSDLEEDFLQKHTSFINNNKRGGGYWIWKPYIILHALNQHAEYGDYVFYCDSGSYFVNTIDYLIKDLTASNQDIFLTEIPLLEYQWTKSECFERLECKEDRFLYSNQRQGTYILVRKTEKSIKFIERYLELCNQYDLLNDSKNEENNKQLIDHRHDQSLLSLLSKKEGIEGFRDISQYGIRPYQYITSDRDFFIKKYKNSTYPQITISYRKDKWFKVFLKEKVKDKLGFTLRG